MIRRWLNADEQATDPVGWTANLAIFRVAFLSAAVLPRALHLLRWISTTMAILPAGIWQPISFYQLIPDHVLRNAGLAHTLVLVDVGLIILGLLGLYTRSALALATIVSLYVFGLQYNVGKVDHFHHDVWALALMAAGPSGEMLSLDALRSAIRRADRGSVEPEVSRGGALTTLRFFWLMIGLLYLSSGTGKLGAAWYSHWLDSANLQSIIQRRWTTQRLYLGNVSHDFRFDQMPSALLRLGFVGAIAFETSAIVFLPFRASRWLVILCGLSFHFDNGLVLGIWFSSLMISYVSMVDWAWLLRVVMTRARLAPITVIYDGGCKLCRRAIAILKTLDTSSELRMVPSTSSDRIAAGHPELTHEMLMRDLYVVGDNTVAGGYDAYVMIATRVPVLWPLAIIMRLAPIEIVGRKIYRRVVDSRHSQVPSSPLVVAGSQKNVHWAPYVVGIFLYVSEAVTVALNTGHGFGIARMIAGRESVVGNYQAWRRVQWRWPFDRYPTFTSSRELGALITWEPRLVHADGSESEIPAEVFAGTFNNQLDLAKENMQEALRQNDPVGRKRHALAVARMLWKNVRPSAKRDVVAMRGYYSVYSTDPKVVAPSFSKLIDTFSVHQLASDAAGSD